MDQTGKNAVSHYLTFRLGEEIFALDVAQVREVLDMSPITKVPGTPDFMRGVINVRGSVVPVIDLRLRFGMSRTEHAADTRIIVMELSVDGEMTVLGTLADSVNEVIELDAGQIEPPPTVGMRWRTEFVRGIGKRNDLFLILLDIDKVFSSDELAAVESSGNRTVPEPAESSGNADETGFSE
ncbi:MAG: chemotaxis protein CheW [Desulfobacterales bacterium]